MLFQKILLDIGQKVVICLFGAGMLWQVALRVGGNGEVVIHVNVPGVVLMVNDSPRLIDPMPGTPVVCELRPGTHTLVATRQGQMIYKESFTVDPGGNHILSVYDDTRPISPPENYVRSDR